MYVYFRLLVAATGDGLELLVVELEAVLPDERQALLAGLVLLGLLCLLGT